MAPGRNKLPDFFGEDGIDPVELATGNRQPLTEDSDTSSAKDAKTRISTKKKAGFYLSKEILERLKIEAEIKEVKKPFYVILAFFM